MAAKKKKKKAPEPRGLTAVEVGGGDAPDRVRELSEEVAADGGSVLGAYRDPLGESWQLLASLPLDKVRATPYQRDLSDAHVKRLTGAIERLGRFLDPVIAIRTADGFYETPNGHHRTESMRRLGARSIVALVVPEPEMAFQILALNTEKAHNLRERSLEVIRMARELVRIDDRPERDFAGIFEEASLLTLGCCYEKNGRFSGSAYHPVLKRVEDFFDAALSEALGTREARRDALFDLDGRVVAIVGDLKERGFESPYLKTYVLARINPLRFKRGATGDFDEILGKMRAAADGFDVGKMKPEQLARTGGASEG